MDHNIYQDFDVPARKRKGYKLESFQYDFEKQKLYEEYKKAPSRPSSQIKKKYVRNSASLFQSAWAQNTHTENRSTEQNTTEQLFRERFCSADQHYHLPESSYSLPYDIIANSVLNYDMLPKFPHFGKQDILDLQQILKIDRQTTGIFIYLCMFNQCFGDYSIRIMNKLIPYPQREKISPILCKQILRKIIYKYWSIEKQYLTEMPPSVVNAWHTQIDEMKQYLRNETTLYTLPAYQDKIEEAIRYCNRYLYQMRPSTLIEKLFGTIKYTIVKLSVNHIYITRLRILLLNNRLNRKGYC